MIKIEDSDDEPAGRSQRTTTAERAQLRDAVAAALKSGKARQVSGIDGKPRAISMAAILRHEAVKLGASYSHSLLADGDTPDTWTAGLW